MYICVFYEPYEPQKLSGLRTNGTPATDNVNDMMILRRV